jgi:hypothetical protein
MGMGLNKEKVADIFLPPYFSLMNRCPALSYF